MDVSVDMGFGSLQSSSQLGLPVGSGDVAAVLGRPVRRASRCASEPHALVRAGTAVPGGPPCRWDGQAPPGQIPAHGALGTIGRNIRASFRRRVPVPVLSRPPAAPRW